MNSQYDKGQSVFEGSGAQNIVADNDGRGYIDVSAKMIAPVVPFINVTSDAVQAIGYRAERETLYLQFHDGVMWEYTHISANRFIEIITSYSIGRALHTLVIGPAREKQISSRRISEYEITKQELKGFLG